MENVRLPVILSEGDDGYITAQVPLIPGCISQGRTVAEALVNIREAAELCLESRQQEGWDLPREFSVEQIEVSA
jgi:predicted RNase H-like HicB family nuclease